ncbi:condensation domain-containing protein [Rhodococcus sp. 3Y1]
MLLQVSPVRHVLAVSFHHIAVDGVSMRTVVGDLLTAYGKRRAGLDSQWSPLPIQYGDFAAWEAARDVSPVVEQFWRRTLDGVTSVSPLTVDHSDGGPDTLAQRVNFVIPAVITSALQARADRLKVSLFAVVHAALSVVLAKLVEIRRRDRDSCRRTAGASARRRGRHVRGYGASSPSDRRGRADRSSVGCSFRC